MRSISDERDELHHDSVSHRSHHFLPAGCIYFVWKLMEMGWTVRAFCIVHLPIWIYDSPGQTVSRALDPERSIFNSGAFSPRCRFITHTHVDRPSLSAGGRREGNYGRGTSASRCETSTNTPDPSASSACLMILTLIQSNHVLSTYYDCTVLRSKISQCGQRM